MQVKAALAPGQNDAKQRVQQYGDQQVCLRYCYEKARQKCIKTVALVVDEQNWITDAINPADSRVALKNSFGKAKMRQQVKNAGS